MDLTDRNNEKFTKLIELFGKSCQISFYYNHKTKDFKYWGISRGGFSPSSPWDEIIEAYVVDNHEYELRSLAEYDIKIRAGRGGAGGGDGLGNLSSKTVYPERYRRG